MTLRLISLFATLREFDLISQLLIEFYVELPLVYAHPICTVHHELIKRFDVDSGQIDALQAERSLDAAERPESISTSTSDTDTQARIEPVTAEEIVVANLHTDDLESMADTEIEMANLHIEDESIAESDIAILEGLLSTWQRRKEAVCFSIVAYHMHQQQFLVALQWLDKLMANSPSDPHLKTKAALIQLQLGDVQGAQRTFSDVEALVSSSSSSNLNLRNLVRRNKGILNVALGQFPEAIAEFDAVLAKDPHDIVSTNNKVNLNPKTIFSCTCFSTVNVPMTKNCSMVDRRYVCCTTSNYSTQLTLSRMQFSRALGGWLTRRSSQMCAACTRWCLSAALLPRGA